MSLIGQTLGQYLVVEFIGAGGMASVYKAYQTSLDRYVAIKVLPAQHALTPGYKERFILEARAVAQLSHPNILPIYDFGLEGDLSYFVMKYVPDHTLSDMTGKTLELARASHFMDQIAGALDHAHTRGILHRDVKPANMLLEGDWLLLTDFGLAKITESSSAITSTGHIFGTPAYVSPEQAEGNPLDHRTDIYSLGIVLYELIIGRVPFEGTTAMRIINKHIYEPPPPPRSLRPDLPEPVEQVMLQALAKKPADRYQHAGDLAKALREAVSTLSAAPARRPRRKTEKQAIVAQPEASQKAPARPVAVVAPAPAPKEPSPQLSPVPTAQPRRSMSSLGLGLVGGSVLLLLIAGLFFFFAGSGDAEGTALATITPSVEATAALVSVTDTPTHSPSAATATAETPPTSEPISTPTPPAAAPTPAATIAPAETIPTSESIPTSTPPAAATPPVSTPAPVETPPTAELITTPTLLAAAPTLEPLSTASISGTLAIPVRVGADFKVYVTGFDGAGINGSAPASLGNARQPMFRRNGQAIIVNGTTTGALRGLFVTDKQGLGPAPLNDKGEAFWPVWSPDGSEIMFVDLDQNRAIIRQSSQLAQSAAAYSQVQVNTAPLTGNNLIWSDDNRLIFQGCADWLGQAGECGIWATNADTINPVRLTAQSGSPTDAKNGLLTYMLADDGDWEIYLLSLAGGQPVNLTNNSSQDGLAALAPDGQSVAYVSDESGSWAVWTITLRDNQKQKWFDLDPQRGTIDLSTWSEERMSWTQ